MSGEINGGLSLSQKSAQELALHKVGNRLHDNISLFFERKFTIFWTTKTILSFALSQK